jgi:hypothetical protein
MELLAGSADVAVGISDDASTVSITRSMTTKYYRWSKWRMMGGEQIYSRGE